MLMLEQGDPKKAKSPNVEARVPRKEKQVETGEEGPRLPAVPMARQPVRAGIAHAARVEQRRQQQARDDDGINRPIEEQVLRGHDGCLWPSLLPPPCCRVWRLQESGTPAGGAPDAEHMPVTQAWCDL